MVALAEPEEAGVVEVEIAIEESVRVTPYKQNMNISIIAKDPLKKRTTARQRSWAAAFASVKSSPVQELAMQVAVLEMKAGVLHRQVSSSALQLPRSALARQDWEQAE